MEQFVGVVTSLATLWVVTLGLFIIMGYGKQYLAWSGRIALKMINVIIMAFEHAFRVLGSWTNMKPKKKKKRRR